MFKNATLYRWSGAFGATVPEFTPTLSTQQFSAGLVPPREPNGALIESDMLAVMLEHRTVPGAQVEKRVNAMAAGIERQTGRKPGKKERRELKDEALLELLPHAFPKQTRVLVWKAPGGMLVLDTASATRADEAVTLLAQCGLTVTPVQTTQTAEARMTAWLSIAETTHPAFDFGRACLLAAEGSAGKAVRYKNADLSDREVRAHIAAGLRAKQLALEWDGEVAFTLTAGLVLKGLEFTVPMAGEWDGDLALFKPTVQAMLDDLLAVLS